MNWMLLSKGEILVCVNSYVETEFSRWYGSQSLMGDGKKLVRLQAGNHYKLEQIVAGQIQVRDETGTYFWFEPNRFNTIKEWRKNKLKKLNSINKSIYDN